MIFGNYTLDDKTLFATERGHLVITPFILSNGKGKILVNRGWISKQMKKDYEEGRQIKTTGEVVISGIIRTTAEKPTLIQRIMNDPKTGHWSYRDVQGMSNVTGTLPVFIEMDKRTSFSIKDVAIGGQSFLDIRNIFKHLEYLM